MNTKLTLTIEADVIAKAKEYASSQGRSLSDIVETYLKAIATDSASTSKITPLVESLRGSFKLPEDFNDKEALTDALTRKYLQD